MHRRSKQSLSDLLTPGLAALQGTCVSALFAVGASGAVGCGGQQPEIQHPSSEEAAPLSDSEPESGSLSVSGLRGTLSSLEIQRALTPRLPKFSRCAAKRSSDLEWLHGGLEIGFHVAVDGSVERAYPTRSTFGDRATESCMLDVAKATHFARPHGGPAELTWSLEIPADPDVRVPEQWDAPELSALRTGAAEVIAERCASAPFSALLHVDTDGQVLAAGAAVPTGEGDSALDCVVDHLETLRFPSPGSYPALVRWELP